eukprot:6385385-Lingulodinium_polyedra.AAC.1
MAVEAHDAHERHDTRALFAIAKKLAPKTSTKLKSIKLEDGSFAANPTDAAFRWRRFFAGKFAGKPERFEQILARMVERQ